MSRKIYQNYEKSHRCFNRLNFIKVCFSSGFIRFLKDSLFQYCHRFGFKNLHFLVAFSVPKSIKFQYIFIFFRYRFWTSFWDGFWIENGCQHGSFWEAFGEPERSKMGTKKRCMRMWVCLPPPACQKAPPEVPKSTPRGAKKQPQRLPRGHLGVLLAISGGVLGSDEENEENNMKINKNYE